MTAQILIQVLCVSCKYLRVCIHLSILKYFFSSFIFLLDQYREGEGQCYVSFLSSRVREPSRDNSILYLANKERAVFISR